MWTELLILSCIRFCYTFFLCWTKTVPSRILSATKKLYIFLNILIKIIIQFFECKSLKEFSSLEQYQYAEGFQSLHTSVKLRCAACLSLQILSFEY